MTQQQPQPIPASAVRAGDHVIVRTSFEGVVTSVIRDGFDVSNENDLTRYFAFEPEAGKQTVLLLEKDPDADLLDQIVTEIGKGLPPVLGVVDLPRVAQACLKALRDHDAAKTAAEATTGPPTTLSVTTSTGESQ